MGLLAISQGFDEIYKGCEDFHLKSVYLCRHTFTVPDGYSSDEADRWGYKTHRACLATRFAHQTANSV